MWGCITDTVYKESSQTHDKDKCTVNQRWFGHAPRCSIQCPWSHAPENTHAHSHAMTLHTQQVLPGIPRLSTTGCTQLLYLYCVYRVSALTGLTTTGNQGVYNTSYHPQLIRAFELNCVRMPNLKTTMKTTTRTTTMIAATAAAKYPAVWLSYLEFVLKSTRWNLFVIRAIKKIYFPFLIGRGISAPKEASVSLELESQEVTEEAQWSLNHRSFSPVPSNNL